MTNNEIRDKIEKTLKEKGLIKDNNIVNYPPKKIDIDSLTFDSLHANKKHTVTEEQAKQFISNAKISITRKLGDKTFENYFSDKGASFVNPEINQISTAFGKEDYKSTIIDILEVVDNVLPVTEKRN